MAVAMVPSQLWANWEPYNKDHGPFEPNSWPMTFSLHPCDSSEIRGPTTGDFVVTSCHRINDRLSTPKIYVGSKSKRNGTWLLVKDCHGVTVAGPQKTGEHSPAGLAVHWTGLDVYWADLNRDGREDFVVKQLLGGNGTIHTFLCNVTFVVSHGNDYVFTATEGLWSGLSYFVDLNGDGTCEFIHTAFVQGGHIKGRDGRGHNYWVYNVLRIHDGRLLVDPRLTPQFPKWIWYTHAANHLPTTQITPFQQRLLWEEKPDRIFWRPKTESKEEESRKTPPDPVQ